MKPSRIANAQNALSIAPANDSPWPVSAFVLLIAGPSVRPLNTSRSARASETSPIKVEVAWALT
jgi:hypothetical protein